MSPILSGSAPPSGRRLLRRAPTRPTLLSAPPPPGWQRPSAPPTRAQAERLSYPSALVTTSTPVAPRPAALAASPRPVTLVDLARVTEAEVDGDPDLDRAPVDPAPAVDPATAPDLNGGSDGDAALITTGRGRRPAHRRTGKGSIVRRLLRVAKKLLNLAVTLVIVALFLSQGAMGLLPFRASYVTTGSMSPGIPVGSLVISQRVPASHIHKGDVITFPHPEKPGVEETHRVHLVMLTEHGEVLITKGDANATPDAWRIPKTGNIWRRVTSARRLGYPFGYLQNPKAHLAVTLLPAFGLAAWILSWIWKPVLAAKKEARP